MEDPVALVQVAAMAANAYGRTDLARRLEGTIERLRDPACHVLVVGEFKQGKSSLVNALVSARICPVDDDVATAVPTGVRFADPPFARVHFEPDAGQPTPSQDIPIDDVATWVTESGNPENQARVRMVEVGLPRPVLATGIVLVDTPGVGGLASVHAATTLAALPMADALLFVSDASQEYNGPELDFLRQARELCPNVACVLTKIDFYPAWRKVADLDRGHLATIGVPAPLLAVSSTLRIEALQAASETLDAESGFPALFDHLRDEVARRSAQGTLGTAIADLRWAIGQLRGQFQGERSALVDPAHAQAALVLMEQAKGRAEQLRGQAARWQQVLSDGIGDLSSDLDHDLRNRLRQAVKEAEDALDASDPAETWEEFEPWLYRRAAEDVAHHYALLESRGRALAEEVARVFAIEGDEVAFSLDPGSPTDALGAPSKVGGLDLKNLGMGQQALTAMRGTYGGMLMFGMVANLLGLAVLSAPVLGIGLFMGRKALREEHERQLANRRAQAKNAVRRYVDDVSFTITKDSRDSLRLVQRQLRDHFASQAEELLRSTTQALAASQRSLSEDEAQRAARLRDIDAELERIAGLSARVDALAST
ncbi:MAG: hypothetical protein QOJ09_2159 [Actinomycetota bacterium]|nr:hypothetical protein [Actinomycetota bacterium]